MLKSSAFNQKKIKKVVYVKLLKLLNAKKKITFHCTSVDEKKELIAVFGSNIQSLILPNIPYISQANSKSVKSDVLKLVYAARIHPIKNLNFLLELIQHVESNVELTIIGVIDDKKYWEGCQQHIVKSSRNISINYVGDLNHQMLMQRLPEFDVYILPTLGENFGHSIFEAFSAGLPVIISDQTPWMNLKEKKVGHDISLSDTRAFIQAIESFAKMDQVEYSVWSTNARLYALNFYNSQDYLNGYTSLFSSIINVGFIAPLPFTRYRGGISTFAENVLKNKTDFLKEGIQLSLINTCIIPRSNSSVGKFNIQNVFNYAMYLFKGIKFIRKNNIDILHLHTSVGFSIVKDTFSVLVFNCFKRTKNILQIHAGEVSQVSLS